MVQFNRMILQRLKTLRSYLFAVFIGIALLYAIPKVVVLAHGGDTALIHGCVKSSNGDIRIIRANATCSSNETALDWNIQGPPGSNGFQLRVVDSQNQEVGKLLTGSSVLRQIGNYWVNFNVNVNGLATQSSVYVAYESSDCTGTPLLEVGLSRSGVIIGNTVYYASEPLVPHYNSYNLYTPPSTYGPCSQDSVDTLMAPLTSSILPSFVAPLSITSN